MLRYVRNLSAARGSWLYNQQANQRLETDRSRDNIAKGQIISEQNKKDKDKIKCLYFFDLTHFRG